MQTISQIPRPAQDKGDKGDFNQNEIVSRIAVRVMLRSEHPAARQFFRNVYEAAGAAHQILVNEGETARLGRERQRRSTAARQGYLNRKQGDELAEAVLVAPSRMAIQ